MNTITSYDIEPSQYYQLWKIERAKESAIAMGFSPETALTVIDTPLAMFGREHITKRKFTPKSRDSKVISRSILVDSTEYVFGTSPLSRDDAKANGITQIKIGYRQFKQMERNSFVSKASCKVIPLPARTPQTVRLLPAPHPALGKTVAIPGLSQHCTIVDVFEAHGDTYAKLTHAHGTPIDAYRKLSDLEVK